MLSVGPLDLAAQVYRCVPRFEASSATLLSTRERAPTSTPGADVPREAIQTLNILSMSCCNASKIYRLVIVAINIYNVRLRTQHTGTLATMGREELCCVRGSY